MKARALLAAVAAAGLVTPHVAAAPEIGSTEVFAAVPAPGFAEGSTIVGDLFFSGTGYGARPNAGGPPSRLLVYSVKQRKLVDSVPVTGVDLDANHGLYGMVSDAQGRVYAGEEQLGVIRFTKTRRGWKQETYSALPNLPACSSASPPCSPTRDDRAGLANDMTFDAKGNLYVADSWQATIWRVPRGGGRPHIWFQDPRLDFVYGANGIRISPDGRRIFFGVTGPDTFAIGGAGRPSVVYSLPLVAKPGPADLRLFHAFDANDDADGIGFGASGKLYVSSIGSSSIIVLDRSGNEVARWPDPIANATSDAPYDFNSTFAFNDKSRTILVVNHVFFTGELPQRNLILETYVGERGFPVPRPYIPR